LSENGLRTSEVKEESNRDSSQFRPLAESKQYSEDSNQLRLSDILRETIDRNLTTGGMTAN